MPIEASSQRWQGIRLLTLLPVLGLALALRLVQPGATALMGDEGGDLAMTLNHAQQLNPFDLPGTLKDDDPSQSRLPFYATVAALHLLSMPDQEAIRMRGGRVDGPAWLGWTTTFVALAVVGALVAYANPWPVGRSACLLPGALAAMLWSIYGWPEFPMNQLAAGRVATGLVGTVGVWATYRLAGEIVDHWAGLFAAGTLAVSTFHVGWSRCAVTTGDVYVTTFVVLATWMLYRLIRDRSGRAMLACGTFTGLALASKLSAVVLLPAAGLVAVLLGGLPVPVSDETGDGETLSEETPRSGRLLWASLLHIVLVVPLAVAFFWPATTPTHALAGFDSDEVRLILWLGALAIYVVGLAMLNRSAWHLGSCGSKWIAVNVALGACIVAFLASPFHLRMEVGGGLAEWWHEFGGRADHETSYVLDLLSCIQVLLIHGTLPVSVLAIGGVVWGLRSGKRLWAVLLLVVMAGYIGAVTLLHYKSTYYLLPILPLWHVMTGGAFAGLLGAAARRSSWLVGLVGALGVVIVGMQTYNAVRFHPHYLLDGVAWRERLPWSQSLEPGFVQYQGATYVVDWLAENAEDGALVGSFFPDEPGFRPLAMLGAAATFVEVARLPEAQDKRLRFGVVFDPAEVNRFAYVILYPTTDRLARHLEAFEPAYVPKVQGIALARVYRRR